MGTEEAYMNLDMPWIVIGDFNVIISLGEHSRAGASRYNQVGIRKFQEDVND